MTTSALPLPIPRWRLRLWHNPESWVLLLSADAWLYLIAVEIWGAALSSVAPHNFHRHGFAPHIRSLDAWPVGVLGWSIMIAAMMFPPLIPQLRLVAARSLWGRRHRAMALFLSGYTALWVVYGVAAEASLQLRRNAAPAMSTALVSLCFLVAAFWQLTPQKRRSLVACHLTMPLAPSGWRADSDCFRYGLRTATSCCVSCWALMFACAAAGHAIWAMLIVTLVSWSERFLPRARQVWFFFALVAAALLAGVFLD
jgi:predicted metal-binding membrane protein